MSEIVTWTFINEQREYYFIIGKRKITTNISLKGEMKEFQRGWIFAFGMGETHVYAIRMRNEIVSKVFFLKGNNFKVGCERKSWTK